MALIGFLLDHAQQADEKDHVGSKGYLLQACGLILDYAICRQGLRREAKHALIRRERANLSYLMRQRGAVDKTGNRLSARLRLRPDTAGPLWDRAE